MLAIFPQCSLVSSGFVGPDLLVDFNSKSISYISSFTRQIQLAEHVINVVLDRSIYLETTQMAVLVAFAWESQHSAAAVLDITTRCVHQIWIH